MPTLLEAGCSEGGPSWSDARIAEAVEVGTATGERVPKRFVEQGLEAALIRKPQERPRRLEMLDVRAEATLIAMACSSPPDGRRTWTMKLLADRPVELEIVESVSDETCTRRGSTDGPSRRRSGSSQQTPYHRQTIPLVLGCLTVSGMPGREREGE